MRAVPALVHRLLGLLHPEWGLRLGPGGSGRRRKGATGVVLEEETRTGTIVGGVPVESATRCSYDGATLESPVLVGSCAFCTLRGATLDQPTLRAGARVVGCDLTGARWNGGAGPEADLTACSLREARLCGVNLGALHLCDLVGARLEEVQLARAMACDFSGALLVDCELEGADLRGSRFRGTTFQGGSLRGARVEGADFGGARGLGPATRRRLIQDGARFHGAWMTRLIQRIKPGGDPVQQHRFGTLVSRGAWVVGLALVGGGVWTSLSPPPAAVSASPPPIHDRVPTNEERNRTRIALKDLRTSLNAAHEAMLANGASQRTWPSMLEFQRDHYDLDGDGPGEVMERLFPNGIPANYLTDSEGGVLPYCNEEPDQATITGVDTDWHYCAQTGRVFAAGGFSGQATLNW